MTERFFYFGSVTVKQLPCPGADCTATEGCTSFGISPDFLLELFSSRKQN